MNETATRIARNAVDLAVNTGHDVLVNAQQAHADALDAMAAAVLAAEQAKQALAAAEDEYAALIAAQEALKGLGTDQPVNANLELFLAYVDDAGNWGGMPLLGGNVGSEDPKSVEALEEAGLITLTEDREPVNGVKNLSYWVHFTEAGEALAKQHGRTIDA